MSAFLVNPETIAAIANYANDTQCFRYGPCNKLGIWEAEQAAVILARENILSVNTRYPDDQEQGASYIKAVIEATKRKEKHPIGYIAKLVDCLEYQSCEHDEYFESKAYKILQSIRSDFGEKLQGYADAPWG